MSWPPDISGLQQLAEAAMITPCRIVRPTGGTFDPNTNQTASTASLQWSGNCNIVTRQVQVGFGEGGEGLIASIDYAVHIPVDATAAAGDLVQVLADDDTVTRAFFVEGIHRPTWEVQQKLQVVEVPATEMTVT